MVWCCIYLFMVLFDFINILVPYLGSGIQELILLIIVIILLGISIYSK